MNMDTTDKALITLGAIAILSQLIVIASFIHAMSNEPKTETIIKETDEQCLQEHANKYCSPNKAIINQESFNCVTEDKPRQRTKILSNKNYFLEEEIDNCTLTKLMEVK